MTLRVNTRVPRRPSHRNSPELSTQERSADQTSLSKLKAYFRAVDQRYQMESETTEASSTPRLDVKLRCEASCRSIDALHTRDDIDRISIDKCHSAGMNEGFEARKTVRDGVGNGVCWTPDERATDKSWQRSKDSCTRVNRRKLLAMTPRLV